MKSKVVCGYNKKDLMFYVEKGRIMTVRAFVLIQTEIEVAKTADVVAALKKLGSEVQSVDSVTGPYDTIVVIEVDTMDKIDTVIEKIHAVAGVHRTVTCVAI